MKTKSRVIRRFALLLALLMAGLCGSAAADELVFPADITAIKAEAFRNCTSLTGSLVIPEGVTEIGEYAFAGCTGLTGLPVIPDTVASIGAHAFDGCAGLSGVLILPETLSMDDTAFANCPNLTVIHGKPSVIVWGGEETPWKGTLDADIWNAVSAFCNEKGYACRYTVLESAVAQAVRDGCNVVISIGDGTREMAEAYHNALFLCLDTAADDVPANMRYVTYRTEQAGFLAGYAAVRLGYRKLGFLGGMSVPDVVRYGKGFVQGADTAAAELGVTNDVSVAYTYSGGFWPSEDVQMTALTWYQNGVEAIFCCGGNQCESVAAAMGQHEGMMIGVDADQADYVQGRVITSAMKAMGFTAVETLEQIMAGNWGQIGGTSEVLGIISAEPARNHVQIPATTQFAAGFTANDLSALVSRLYNGELTVDITAPIAITVNEQ